MRKLILTAAFVASFAADAAPRFWGSLTPGVHAVGFQVLRGESAPGSAGWQPRPVEIAVWYPAQAGPAAKALTYGEYFAIAEDLRRRSAPGETDARKTLSAAISGAASAVPGEQAQAILDAPMFARRDAAPAAGPFPVVLWSARYGTTAAQAVLSEFLASRGYVVVTVRPVAASEKLPFELKTPEEKLEELDAQTDDLRGALRAVRALAHASDERTAVLAWSYAGESAWRLAQGDSRIELVIGLDTNVRANWVYQPAEALAAIDAAPRPYEFLALDKTTPELSGVAHGNFNAIEGMIPGVAGIERVQRWSKSGAIARTGYEIIARRVAAAVDGAFARTRPRPYVSIEIAGKEHPVTADLYRAAGAGNRCAALFHQSGSSRGEYRTIAPELVRMGYTVLAIDVRWGDRDRWNDVANKTAARHGTSAAWARGDREKVAQIRAGESDDLDAPIDWLRANGCSAPIVVWGASIQANGVLELALRRPEHVGAVVDVSPGEYKKDAPHYMKEKAARVRTPVLVLWGRGEDEVSKPVFDALPAGAKSSYQSHGRHGNAAFFEDPQAWTRVRSFLERR
jgi:dienelactone hydrolase